MSSRHPSILNPRSCQIILVDLQEPFLRNVTEAERVIDRCSFLAQSAKLLDVPLLATTQNSVRLGGLISQVQDGLNPSTVVLDKLTFSCGCDEAIVANLRDNDRPQVLLAGIETHICIAQTALDLLQHGYQVHVAADAVSSRGMDRHKLGMEKMRDFGVIPCSAEQAIFEMLHQAGSEQFKAVLKLVKG